MLEDKLRETDWELTQETIEEQVARESYLQWLQEQDKYAKTRTSVSNFPHFVSYLIFLYYHFSLFWKRRFLPR